jgi:hypothetical protein
MRSHPSFMATCVSLAACFLCATGAFAQTQPVPQPDPAGRSALEGVPGNVRLPTFEWTDRRYKIEAVRFKARDETGIDWLGSDEVMIGTEDVKGWTVSDEFGDVDSGETRNFDPAKSCIVAVRPGVVVLGKTSVCDNVGEPAPLGFEVEFWEKDPISFPAGFCVPGSPLPGRHAGPHCVNDHDGDDFIGRARLDFSMQELETALPNVGAEYIETVTLSPCPKDQDTCGAADFPDYTFSYRVTRLPDVPLELSSVLAETMLKIGARSELEAIVAGLRSLRALSPRKIETETVLNLAPGR